MSAWTPNGEDVENKAARRALALTNRRLKLILLPTEQCNFRCTYCYEDFKEKQMSRDVVSATKRFLELRTSELDSLVIEWYGGEPLVAFSVVSEISEWVVRLQEQRRFAYVAAMTTNGSLLRPDRAATLAALGVRHYQISLDGFRAGHDMTRRRADGKGTFEKIWANLLSLHASSLPIDVVIRVHMSPANLSSLEELLDAIDESFGDDPRFTVFLKRIGHWGGPNDDKFSVLDETQAAGMVRTLRKRLTRIRTDDLDAPSEPCYAGVANSLVIRSNGSLAKCTIGLNDERNQVGNLLPDGTLEIHQERFRAWLLGLEDMDEQILACPYKALRARGPQVIAPKLIPVRG